MKLSSIITKPLIFSLTFSTSLSIVFAQDGAQGGGGGESAAESSVTTSSSKKPPVLPEAVESNPIVSIIRSGISTAKLSTVATNLSKDDFISIAKSGSGADLRNVANSINTNKSDISTVAEITKKGGSSKNSLARAEVYKEVIADAVASGLSNEYLNKLVADIKNPSVVAYGSNDGTADEIKDAVKKAKQRASIVVNISKVLGSSVSDGSGDADLLKLIESVSDSSAIIDDEKLEKQERAVATVATKFTESSSDSDTTSSYSSSIFKNILQAEADEITDEFVKQQEEVAENIATEASSGTNDPAKLSFKLALLSYPGVTSDVAEFAYIEFTDGNNQYLQNQTASTIGKILALGFSVTDLENIDSEEKFAFYSKSYDAVYTIGTTEYRLSKDEVILAFNAEYTLDELTNLTLLVKNPENDGTYSVESLDDSDLGLIISALTPSEEANYEFNQAEALLIGKNTKGYDSTNLSNIDALLNSSTDWELTKVAFLENGSIDFQTSTFDGMFEPISLSQILGQDSDNFDLIAKDEYGPGISYALFKTLESMSSTFEDLDSVNPALEALGNDIGLLLRTLDLTPSSNESLSNQATRNADNFVNQPYFPELATFLAHYNILGQNGYDVLSLIENNGGITKQKYLSGYLGYLATYTGSRTFGDDFDTVVADIRLDNVTLLPANTINIAGYHDVSDLIDPAPLTNNNVNSDDIKIFVAGAAKDFTITGDLTIHNDNKVEDHALVLAAADDLYLRSEYSSANAEDYNNPEPINIEYTGSNLAIASQDTMVLVNAKISTGGNLAIGTLDELHIGLSDNHHTTLTLGTGGNTPSPDNLYLYANELLSIRGLDIEGRVSKVYMEASTIALRHVHFPTDSRVMLRSRTGEMNFGSTPIDGHVNLYNTSHASIRDGANLARSDFAGSVGHYNSIATHPNGEPYISIRAQEANQ